jgi:hypothetical protein
MSQKHQRVLAAILQEPISGNIHWREVEAMLHYLGAIITPGHGTRLHIELNGVHGTLHRPHHSGVCEKHDLRHIREFLTQADVGT